MSTVVLKIGGEVVADPTTLRGTLDDIRALVEAGHRIVVVHGAGPQAAQRCRALELPVRMAGGQRVTDAATLRVVKGVLAGEVSVDLVAAAVAAGLRAVGLSGVSDGLLSVRRRAPVVVAGEGTEPVDYGFVGTIEQVRPQLLTHLLDGGFVPFVNPLGTSAVSGPAQVYNVNADTVAAALAASLGADHLLLVTAVGGVRRDKDDPATRVPKLTATQAQAAISDGTISGGMIPKVAEALEHLSRGIKAVHIVGPGPVVIREAAEQPGRHGTVLVPDPQSAPQG